MKWKTSHQESDTESWETRVVCLKFAGYWNLLWLFDGPWFKKQHDLTWRNWLVIDGFIVLNRLSMMMVYHLSHYLKLSLLRLWLWLWLWLWLRLYYYIFKWAPALEWSSQACIMSWNHALKAGEEMPFAISAPEDSNEPDVPASEFELNSTKV